MSNIEPVVHGALDYAELERLGLQPAEMLDFSVNVNPYGPSPRVHEAMLKMAIDRYPDRECLALRRAILASELATLNTDYLAITCGNGSVELIWALARAYLGPHLKAGIIGPTFGEYRAASQATGATVIEWRAQPADDFQHAIPAVVAWILRERPTLLWMCNPNNPTGTQLEREQVCSFAEACHSIGTILVIDEAYHHFVVPRTTFSSAQLLDMTWENTIIVLRSLTKDYALAGLRLGYAISAPRIGTQLRAQLPSWNVNSAAQEAGMAALGDSEHLTTTLANLADERLAFFQAARQMGLHIIPSRTHFCLLEVGDAPAVRQQLLKRKMVVRDCTSFGLPSFIRVATRPEQDWRRLLLALEEIL